ncbi:hypothetical protein RB195_013539 [Necator americanus]|uniref:Uncharacterized protein n=1 Tax=Necator americanus TaxID=51031 RepID=A0ABR1DW52_NECAM
MERRAVLAFVEGVYSAYYDNVTMSTDGHKSLLESSDFHGIHVFADNETSKNVVKYFLRPSYDQESVCYYLLI